MLPLLAFVAAAETGRPGARPLGRWAAWGLGAALLTQAGAIVVRGGPLAPSDFLEHSTAARFILDRWPERYNPKPEVFVERTLGHEGPRGDPVVYRDDDVRNSLHPAPIVQRSAGRRTAKGQTDPPICLMFQIVAAAQTAVVMMTTAFAFECWPFLHDRLSVFQAAARDVLAGNDVSQAGG